MTQTAYKLYQEIINYYDSKNKFPDMEYLCNKFKKDKETIFNYIKELIEAGYLVREGKNIIVKKMRVPKDSVKKEPTFKVDFNFIFKICIAIIGLIATGMSMYFTFFWFNSFFPVIVAILLSIAIVGFSVIAFESIILFKYKGNIGAMWLFIVLWSIVLFLSMTTTIAGQVNKNIENKLNKKDVKNNNNVLLYNQINTEINNLNIDLNNKRKDRESLNSLLQQYNNNPAKYNSVMYQINIKDKEILELNRIIELKNVELKNLLKDNNLDLNKESDNITFYQWAYKVTGINENVIEFFLGLFFALFLDIISPVSFSIILMLDKKVEKKKKK